MGRLRSVGIRRTGVLAAALTLGVATLLLQPHISAAADGTIIGVITTKEAARPPVRATVDPTVCGTSLPDESITVDGSGHLANVVVTVTGVKVPAPAETTVNNEKCRFTPRVSILKPAGLVKVTNKDPNVLHTTHLTAPDGNDVFNIALPIQNMTISKPISKRLGVCKIVCETHTWMRGWLFVTDELSAVSGADGSFRLENVPVGTQEVRLWHEALKAAPQKVAVKDGETVTVNFTLAK